MTFAEARPFGQVDQDLEEAFRSPHPPRIRRENDRMTFKLPVIEEPQRAIENWKPWTHEEVVDEGTKARKALEALDVARGYAAPRWLIPQKEYERRETTYTEQELEVLARELMPYHEDADSRLRAYNKAKKWIASELLRLRAEYHLMDDDKLWEYWKPVLLAHIRRPPQ